MELALHLLERSLWTEMEQWLSCPRLSAFPQASMTALRDQFQPESCLAELALKTWKLEEGWLTGKTVVMKETKGMLLAIEY